MKPLAVALGDFKLATVHGVSSATSWAAPPPGLRTAIPDWTSCRGQPPHSNVEEVPPHRAANRPRHHPSRPAGPLGRGRGVAGCSAVGRNRRQTPGRATPSSSYRRSSSSQHRRRLPPDLHGMPSRRQSERDGRRRSRTSHANGDDGDDAGDFGQSGPSTGNSAHHRHPVYIHASSTKSGS